MGIFTKLLESVGYQKEEEPVSDDLLRASDDWDFIMMDQMSAVGSTEPLLSEQE